jgi:electron transport complex protein RnfD
MSITHPAGSAFSHCQGRGSQGAKDRRMTRLSKTLTIRSSPHIGSAASVDTIMFNVVLALMPVAAYAVYTFGLAALLVLMTAVATCVLTEHLLCRIAGQATTLGDWSVVITGLLYGLVLPPSLPLWMVVAGGVIAVGIGKFLFGGLGYNPFNPALVGRAILQAAFPAAMTTWPESTSHRFASLPSSSLAIPLMKPDYDGVSSATPLASWKFDQVGSDTGDLFIGSVAGSIGETSALIILMGGVYLVARRMMSWRIPVAILATVGLCSGVLHAIDPQRYATPLFMLFSGGLMLGAVFMATDMVASPITHLGCVLYGVLIGLLVLVIRIWGGMPEGVMYAILIANAVSPHIDHWIQPRVYGTLVRGNSG